MAELTGKPMEQIVNWFMLLIIFVFDPLALAMVVAANMAFAQIKDFKPKEEQKDYKVYKKNEDIEPKVIIKEVPVEKIVEVEKVVEVEKKKVLPKEKPPSKIKPKPYVSPWGSPGGKKS